MQTYKRAIGGRVSSRPEVHFAQQYLLSQALERFAAASPDLQSLEAALGRNVMDYTQDRFDQADKGVLLVGVPSPISKARPLLRGGSMPREMLEAGLRVSVREEADEDLRSWSITGKRVLLLSV